MINAIPKTIAATLLTFKLILCLNNNWEAYKENGRYKVWEVEVQEVEKMLSCMDPEKGYTVYMCVGCIVMVLHPFGRDLKTNMHVHMMVTEGGLADNGKWIEMPYIDYRIIRKKWQYEILTAMRKAMPEDKGLAKVIDWCFRERSNGFNIQAKRR